MPTREMSDSKKMTCAYVRLYVAFILTIILTRILTDTVIPTHWEPFAFAVVTGIILLPFSVAIYRKRVHKDPSTKWPAFQSATKLKSVRLLCWFMLGFCCTGNWQGSAGYEVLVHGTNGLVSLLIAVVFFPLRSAPGKATGGLNPAQPNRRD